MPQGSGGWRTYLPGMWLFLLVLLVVLSPVWVGLILAIVPVVLNRLCGPGSSVRRVALTGYVAGYVAVGIWVNQWLGTGYARAIAAVDPGGDCNWGAGSGCRPTDLRPIWIFFWAVAGVIAYGVVRRHSAGRTPAYRTPVDWYNQLVADRGTTRPVDLEPVAPKTGQGP